MDKINDGGPAFAAGAFEHNSSGSLAWQDGMSLRDYFAAKALAALISNPLKDGPNLGKKAVPKLAVFAYEYADAMLEAREPK